MNKRTWLSRWGPLVVLNMCCGFRIILWEIRYIWSVRLSIVLLYLIVSHLMVYLMVPSMWEFVHHFVVIRNKKYKYNLLSHYTFVVNSCELLWNVWHILCVNLWMCHEIRCYFYCSSNWRQMFKTSTALNHLRWQETIIALFLM